ncbi:MAG: lycopene cyclase family protein [Ilumatobacteraceae bacterium]
MSHDVVIVGSGPAGAALARSLVIRGMNTVVVGPPTPWHATYGAWRDDVVRAEIGQPLGDVLRGSWNIVRVVGSREQLLRRSYVVFDNSRLRAALLGAVAVRDDIVTEVSHGVSASTVQLASGTTIDSLVVVDCTGSGEFLARRTPRGGAQTAYGVVADADVGERVGVRSGVFTLMDWSRPPTFLYGAPFPDGSVLLEETSLFANPPRPIEQLAERLDARLGMEGAVRSTERVTISMGDSLPARTTRVVGFGAAAGYVHPVTGYSVAASLRAAPRVAAAIEHNVKQGRRGGELSAAIWKAVWPREQLRTRAWHDMGLEVLSSLPDAAIAEFFDAFFSMPMSQWSAYLRVDAPAREVQAAMLGVFRRVGLATKLKLMSSPGGLLRALASR